ncbi:PDZ domain-containing protein [Thalassotalea euphylliae]|uniref:PDZ domain-containing protein n=1 Tax=Thalassotalea euphylliae TaxID=1655234 RepID=A0A3E0U493_9GAMM|nr:PDZ domain-containing protein [Thalassotalea euphylliae]REL31383.1 PDZ domain-containing protein [Thalassotalea euphylliae]
MKLLVTILFSLLSSQAFAAEKGEKGFVLDVNVSGFFSPEVTKATIKSVVKGSSAEQEGLKIGDQIIAIDGCQIPGCDAKKAKKSLQKQVGEMVLLNMMKPNGETYEANVALQ